MAPLSRIRLLLAAVALAAPAAFPATALAHANLLFTTPAAGSVVAHAPAEIVLHFDQQIQPVAGGTDVVNDGGTSVIGGPAHNSPKDVRALVIPLQRNLPDGNYTVRWRIVSTDGHIISGVLAIGVGAGRPPPQAATTESSPIDLPYLIARSAYFTGLMLLVGGLVYRLAVWLPVEHGLPAQRREMAALRERHRATQLGTLAAVLLLGGGWVALTRQGAEVAGVSFWQAFNHNGPVGSALQATRFGREFGRGIDLAAVFVILAASAFWLARRSRPGALALAVPATALGVWAVVVPGLSGHAGDPGLGTLAVIVDAVHVASAAIWIGGLAQLVWVMPHATRGLAGEQQSAARLSATRRFSTLALASVIVVAATGGARALWEVSAVSQLWTTGYGRTLIVKTVLLAGLIALGYRNRSALERFAEIRRRGVVERADGGAAGRGVGADEPAARQCALAGIGRIVVAAGGHPGRAGPRRAAGAGGMAGDGRPQLVRHPHEPRLRAAGGDGAAAAAAGISIPMRRVGDVAAGLVPRLAPGTYTISVVRGASTLRRDHRDRDRPPRPGTAAAPNRTGAVAAEEAGDLAVGMQRAGPGIAAVTLIGQSGSTVPDALVTFAGRTALPCGTAPGCYRVRVPGSAVTAAARVLRPSQPAVAARIALPAADAPLRARWCGRPQRRTARSRACDPRTCSRPTHNTRCTPRFSRTPPTSSRSTSTAASGRSSSAMPATTATPPAAGRARRRCPHATRIRSGRTAPPPPTSPATTAGCSS